MSRYPQAHGPSCAKRIRREGVERGRTNHEIARSIHDHCSVMLLRAHRLARGLTQQAVAESLRTLGEAFGERSPKADAIQLGHWETGRHHPKPVTIGLLCEFYDCTPAELGFADAAAVRAAASSGSLVSVDPSYAPTRGRPAGGISFGERVDAARRSVDRTLATSSVSLDQLDILDERVLWARQQYVYTPPTPMLDVLLGHLAEVEDLAADRQPAAVQVRLSELTSMLATLIADALMKLGDLTRSQAWYGTARSAADDSGNAELQARVRAQAAMLPFYYGPLEAAVALSREAKMICRGKGKPSATGAFAAAAEARALAKLGDTKGATAALRDAAAIFEQSGPGGEANDAFSFPERRFLLYQSGTLTALGQTLAARRIQEQALALYPTKTGIDPALLSFEAAICLAHDRSPTEACQLAGATLQRIRPAHRTPIVEQRAREVINVLPPAIRRGQAARDLRAILALPAGQM